MSKATAWRRARKLIFATAVVALTFGVATGADTTASPAPVTATVEGADTLALSGAGVVTAKKKAKKQDWFTEMRKIMNRVGGKHVKLVKFDGKCGKKKAEACTFYSGTKSEVAVAKRISKWSKSRKVWAMTHELAHTYQVKILPKLKKSKNFKKMFRGNLELLANCMASAKGATNHGHYCSKKMVKAAKKVWKGKTP